MSLISDQAIQQLSPKKESEYFPFIDAGVIADTLMSNKAVIIVEEMKRRYKVFRPMSTFSETETTMREFISPILIAAVELMIDHALKENDELKMKKMCEKRIFGLEFGGPVDYVIFSNMFAIPTTEAKPYDPYSALLQNILQQRSAQEFQAMALWKVANDRCKKRKYIEEDETFAEILKLGSYGIVSNGAEWIFNKLFLGNPDDPHLMHKVYMSNKYCITLTNPTVEEVTAVLSRICSIINRRLGNIGEIEVYKRVKLNMAQINAAENDIVNEVEASQQEEDSSSDDEW